MSRMRRAVAPLIVGLALMTAAACGRSGVESTTAEATQPRNDEVAPPDASAPISEADPTPEASPSQAANPSGPSVVLVPASLPDGWDRCRTGPVDEPTPEGSQTESYGPIDGNGECTTRITVTQLPVTESRETPRSGSWDDVKVGDHDGAYLLDPETNRHLLFMWAFQRNLLFEADAAIIDTTTLLDFADRTYQGQRQSAPERCVDERSDLSTESLRAQLSSANYRMFLDDGCPVRFEVAAIGSFSETHHCWPGLETGRLGALYFYKDPERLVGRAELTARLQLDVVLPDAATDTGYRQGTRSLWLDPSDQTVVYVADAQHAEAWPVADLELGCD